MKFNQGFQFSDQKKNVRSILKILIKTYSVFKLNFLVKLQEMSFFKLNFYKYKKN